MMRHLLCFTFVFLGHQAQAVINGDHVNSSQTRSTVSIFDTATSSQCTGVVIHERVILTAGHCVYGVNPNYLIFSTSSATNSNSGTSLRILTMQSGRGYRGARDGVQTVQEGDNDIGVIVFAESILHRLGLKPSDLPQLALDSDSASNAMSRASALLIIGYGFTSRGQIWGMSEDEATEKRQFKVMRVAGSSIARPLFKGVRSQQTACFGDSGSGLFADTDSGRVLVGTLTSISATGALAAEWNQKRSESRTGQLSADETSKLCGDPGNVAHVTPLSEHICWIQDVAGVDLGARDCRR